MNTHSRTGDDQSLLLFLFFVLVTLAAVTWGCTSTGAAWPGVVKPGPAKVGDPIAEAKVPAPDSSLAAVEAFLERTRDFPMPAAGVTAPPGSLPTTSSTAARIAESPADTTGKSAKQDTTPSAAQVANVQAAISVDPAPPAPRVAAPVLKSLTLKIPPVPKASEPSVVEDAGKANTGIDAADDARPVSIEQLTDALEERIAQADDFDANWRLRMLYLAQNRDEDARRRAPHMADSAFQIWSGVVDALLAVRAAARQPGSGNEDAAIDEVSQLRSVLLSHADPRIQNIALCSKVSTFGVYDELPAEELAAGRSIAAIVYCELENLRLEPMEDGNFRAVLSARLDLMTAAGESVWNAEQPKIIDICRRRRSDFFLAQRVTLPPTLRAGEYVLKVAVEDEQSGRAAESSLRFQISPVSSMARGK